MILDDFCNKREVAMKVFISWSGAKSKKVAIIFRDWLPQVIQSVETFVSSEDIEKGSRWNTDIAQELKESTFGIICVTKDNLNAPWLNFEAGALSKTIDNTYVAPFLFNIKPSELSGSPISQFQATSFSKDDLKRLIDTLNVATGNSLTPQRLDTAFELCYSSLEDQLNKLLSEEAESESSNEEGQSINILEEILETSRNTQRILGNTDLKLNNNIETLQNNMEAALAKYSKRSESEIRKINFRIDPMILEETFLSNKYVESEFIDYNLLITLSYFKEDFPWIYDSGKDLIDALNSNKGERTKYMEINKFKRIIEFTAEHPFIRYSDSISRKNISLLFHYIDRYIDMLVSKYKL